MARRKRGGVKSRGRSVYAIPAVGESSEAPMSSPQVNPLKAGRMKGRARARSHKR